MLLKVVVLGFSIELFSKLKHNIIVKHRKKERNDRKKIIDLLTLNFLSLEMYRAYPK